MCLCDASVTQSVCQQVQLSYIVEREGGLDAVQDFMDVLSGGEKQRIAVSIQCIHPVSSRY